jgi:hypothetical protein
VGRSRSSFHEGHAVDRARDLIIRVARFACLGFHSTDFLVHAQDLPEEMGIDELIRLNFLRQFNDEIRSLERRIVSTERPAGRSLRRARASCRALTRSIENLDQKLTEFIERKRRANAFDIRYADTVDPKGEPWEKCARVLSRRDVVERLSRGW